MYANGTNGNGASTPSIQLGNSQHSNKQANNEGSSGSSGSAGVPSGPASGSSAGSLLGSGGPSAFSPGVAAYCPHSFNMNSFHMNSMATADFLQGAAARMPLNSGPL